MTTLDILPDSRRPLSADVARTAFDDLLDGKVTDAEAAGFLNAMSTRNETSVEITAVAQSLRARMLPISAPPGTIDVCGTGGDGSHSLNVSTAVAITVAACGVPVAKHGNRAASSKAGAADTLEAIGLDLDRCSSQAEAQLSDLGICFLFAQHHHPALARLAPLRRRIGRRTIFNLVGPLANPAAVRRQLIGVARPDYLPVYHDTLRALDYDDAMLVAGDESLDELSVAGKSSYLRLNGSLSRIGPSEAGLSVHPGDALRGGDPAYNAAALRSLLQGSAGAYRDSVLFNAAAALMIADRVSNWADGVEEAAEAIDGGRANALLQRWVSW